MYPTLYDKSVYQFSGKKITFAEKIMERASKGETIDFSGFAETFKIINELIRKN
jgi:acyl CoA:acetate/3-ketoacid CoA transferase alpha subunit